MSKGPRSTSRRSVGKRKSIRAQRSRKRNGLVRLDRQLGQLHEIGVKLLILYLLVVHMVVIGWVVGVKALVAA
jgi:hypothetical protein